MNEGEEKSVINSEVLSNTSNIIQESKKIEPRPPALWVKSLLFSDETEIAFNQGDVVVFVGPNNAGKSQALKEIHAHLSGNPNGKVVKNAVFDISGTDEELLSYITTHSTVKDSGKRIHYFGYRFSVRQDQLHQPWNQKRASSSPLFLHANADWKTIN